MKVRAAVLEEFGTPLVVQEVDLTEPGPGEALVRLVACGVCHTDAYTASGVDPTGYAPCVLGHEGAGVVERVGEGVRLVKPGDHVVTLFAPECGVCIHCRSGRTNRCIVIRDQQNAGYLPDGTTRLFRNGEPLRHFMGCSTFAEYTVMPEIALAVVNPDAPLDGCAPFACGLSTGIGAALYTATVEAGSTVVVFGCGLVGLGAIIGARLSGAERIIAIDLSTERLEQARHHGATDVRLADAETVDWIRAETGVHMRSVFIDDSSGRLNAAMPGTRRLPDGTLAWRNDRRRPHDYPHILAKLEELPHVASRITCPVLVVRGGRSRVLTDEKVASFAGLLHRRQQDLGEAGAGAGREQADVVGDLVEIERVRPDRSTERRDVTHRLHQLNPIGRFLEVEPRQHPEMGDHQPGVLRLGVEAGPNRGAADVHRSKPVSRLDQLVPVPSNRSPVGGKLLTEADRSGILEVGSARFENPLELASLGQEGGGQALERGDQRGQRGQDGEPHRGRNHVVGTLGHVDVIIGMNGGVAPPGASQKLVGPVGKDLITVHVVGGSGAGLVDIDDEMLAVFPGENLVGGGDDGVGMSRLEPTGRLVGHRRRSFDPDHGIDEGREGFEA